MGKRRCGPAIAMLCLAMMPPYVGAPRAAALQSARVALPATPQGALAAEYVRTFNSGDESAMLTLMRERGTDAMRARRTDDERLKTFHQLRERLGTVEVADVTIAEPIRLDFVVVSQTGPRAIYTMTFDTSTPPRFDSISVEIRIPER